MPGSLSAAEPGGVLEALRALPFKFNNGVLQVSARDAAPLPSRWVVVARDADTMGTITQLTISGGEVISQRPSFNLGQMFRSDGFFQVSDILVDAAAVFATVQKSLGEAGSQMASADYRLGRPASDLVPVWTVTARSAAGQILGQVRISAQTGHVLAGGVQPDGTLTADVSEFP